MTAGHACAAALRCTTFLALGVSGLVLLTVGCAMTPSESAMALVEDVVDDAGLPVEWDGFSVQEVSIRPHALYVQYLRHVPPAHCYVLRFARSAMEQRPEQFRWGRPCIECVFDRIGPDVANGHRHQCTDYERVSPNMPLHSLDRRNVLHYLFPPAPATVESCVGPECPREMPHV